MERSITYGSILKLKSCYSPFERCYREKRYEDRIGFNCNKMDECSPVLGDGGSGILGIVKERSSALVNVRLECNPKK